METRTGVDSQNSSGTVIRRRPTSSQSNTSSAKTLRIQRSAKDKALRAKGPARIPKCAELGLNRFPLCIKLLILASFLSIVCLTTPFWGRVNKQYGSHDTFGLWHYCTGSDCSSLYDFVLRGKSVPASFYFIQGTYCIGTVMCFVGLGILVHNFNGKDIKMTAIMHMTSCCLLGISTVQQFVSLYVFASSLESMDFLYHHYEDVIFYGSFFSGLAAMTITLFSALFVFADREMTLRVKPEPEVEEYTAPPPTLHKVHTL